DETDLWDMVSEEVSLALPTVPIDPESEYSLESNETKADPQAISTNLGERGDSGGSGDKSEEGVKRANPFEILSQLVVDKK
ncbi:MAG: hypothetical protein AAF671_09900, partial [Pseudomonadota bacterium]